MYIQNVMILKNVRIEFKLKYRERFNDIYTTQDLEVRYNKKLIELGKIFIY